MPADAVPHLPGEVEPPALVLEHLDHPDALLVVPEPSAARAPRARRRGPSSPAWPKGVWPEIVPQRDGFGQVLVQAQRPGDTCARCRTPRACGSAGSGSGRPPGQMKTWVLCFSRRNALQWTMRSRSRWKGVRRVQGSSVVSARATRTSAGPAERGPPRTRSTAKRILPAFSCFTASPRPYIDARTGLAPQSRGVGALRSRDPGCHLSSLLVSGAGPLTGYRLCVSRRPWRSPSLRRRPEQLPTEPMVHGMGCRIHS